MCHQLGLVVKDAAALNELLTLRLSASDADSKIDCDKLVDNLSLTESLSLFAVLADSLALRYSLCATLKDSLFSWKRLQRRSRQYCWKCWC